LGKKATKPQKDAPNHHSKNSLINQLFSQYPKSVKSVVKKTNRPPAVRSGQPGFMKKTLSSLIVTQIAIAGFCFSCNNIITIDDSYVA
jgi:hypothetical protein